MSTRATRYARLAIDGGAPLRGGPFAPWPAFEADELAAAQQVLRSGKVNYWTGDEGKLFEQEYAAYLGVRHAVALANGTVALELALRVLGIGEGDEVIVPSRSFFATASCVLTRQARPVFAEVDRDSGNLDPACLEQLITPRTRAILVVHLAGWPAEMKDILRIARQHGLKVIEDCAQAHGATYQERPVGSWGEVAAFSFCQDKIMTTGGEGGLLATDDEALWERAWSFKDHGKSYRASLDGEHGTRFRWLHESVGSNFRLTEMQSALGRVLLRKLPERVARRRRLAQALREGLCGLPALRVPAPAPQCGHSFYKFYAFVRPERLRPGWDRDRVIAAIHAEGIPCFAGGCSEIYLEKAIPEEMRPARRWPVARELGETSVMFLVHPTLSPAEMTDTVKAVEKVLHVAGA